MNKEFKCIDFNSKQKKHYEKWKKLIKDLSKVNDKKNEKKDKIPTILVKFSRKPEQKFSFCCGIVDFIFKKT